MAADNALAKASSILIIGGGIAGLETAWQAAQSGCTVYLLYRDELGGTIGNLPQTFPLNRCEELPYASQHTCTNPCTCLSRKKDEVKGHPLIHLYQSELLEVEGEEGNFLVRLKNGLEVEVGSIILAAGITPYLDIAQAEFGYGTYQNVLLGPDYEKMLLKERQIRRPSDQKVPANIAFIQCVGSRDFVRGKEYCSSVCCLYATKEALLTKEMFKEPEIATTIFYQDLRIFGKEDERYVRLAKENRVDYYQCMISQLTEDPLTKNLMLTYFDGTKMVEEEYELVVLAAALTPPPDFKDLVRKLSIKTNADGFIEGSLLDPFQTSRPGIYAVGAIKEPKSISRTVTESAAVLSKIGAPSPSFLKEEELIPGGVSVITCQCPKTEKMGLEEVLTELQKENELTSLSGDFCSAEGEAELLNFLQKEKPDGILLLKCKERFLEEKIKKVLWQMGLSSPVASLDVSILDDNRLLKEAQALLRRLLVQRPLAPSYKAVSAKALIIGGGLAGMVCALALAQKGIESLILEKEKELGGNLKTIRRTAYGEDLKELKETIFQKIAAEEKIEVLLNAKLVGLKGALGNYEATLELKDKAAFRREKVGAVVVASGAVPYKPGGYLAGEDSRVIYGSDLEEALDGAEKEKRIAAAKEIDFIQCVGSRDEKNPFCRRTCCLQSLKNALYLKKKYPELKINILYRDLQSDGFYERIYHQAREAGIFFLRYEEKNPPQLTKNQDKLILEVLDKPSNIPFTLNPDLLIIANGTEVNTDNPTLSHLLHLYLDEDGYFLPSHSKWKPVSAPKEGIFLCGTALAPATLDETVIQALAAASLTAKALDSGQIKEGGIVAFVDKDKCAACLTCVRFCPYGAPYIGDEMKAVIEPAQCMGCGLCVAECPAKAIELLGEESRAISAQLDFLLEGVH